MPFLIGSVNPDQNLELVNTPNPESMNVYSTGMQEGRALERLDLSAHIGKVVVLSAQLFSNTDIYGAQLVSTL